MKLPRNVEDHGDAKADGKGLGDPLRRQRLCPIWMAASHSQLEKHSPILGI
jgi:hypothetical protein